MGTWKVIPHEKVPFVLSRGKAIDKNVFEFLQRVHARGMSTKTIRAYAFDLLAFHRFLEAEAIPQGRFDARRLTEFLLSQKEDRAAPRTVNRRLTVVRAFLNYQEAGWGEQVFGQTGSFYKGARNKSLLGPLRIKGRKKSLSVKVPGILITPLASGEIQKFMSGLRSYRDHAIVQLMLLCGLRSCEVLALQTNDVDVIDDQIRVRGKGQKERILPLSSGVRKALMNYLDYERPECSHPQCFVALKGRNRGRPLTSEGLRKLFRRQRKRKGLARANAHLFRHTFATHLIRENVSLAVVQKLLGHSDIEVTMGYVHLSLSDVSREYHRAMTTLQPPHE